MGFHNDNQTTVDRHLRLCSQGLLLLPLGYHDAPLRERTTAQNSGTAQTAHSRHNCDS